MLPNLTPAQKARRWADLCETLELPLLPEGTDLYRALAAQMFEVPLGEVTETQRRYAKVLAYYRLYSGRRA